MNTPGPWRAGNNGDCVVADVPVQEGPLGSDAFQHYGGHLVAESIAPCNQPLIAAAPELLAALKAEEEWRGREEAGALDAAWDYELLVGNLRRAAIAKAEGR